MKKSLQKRLEILKISTLRPDLRLGLVGLIFLSLCLMRNSQAYPYVVAENYYVLDDPRQSATADFNGDGFDDLAVVNFRPSQVSILLNTGNGDFFEADSYATGGQGTNSIAVADFDQDLDLDIAVTNFTSDTINILKNNGNGTFSLSAESYKTRVGLAGLTSINASNLNADAYPDLVVANYYTGILPNGSPDYISVLLNNGDGTFASAVDYAVADAPMQIISADFDGINGNDLAVSSVRYGLSQTVKILLNNGSGVFAPAPNTPTLANMGFITAGDFDNDGDVDLAGALLYLNYTGSFLVYENDGNAEFTNILGTYNTGIQSTSIISGDFDNQLGLDLAVCNYADNTINIFSGNNDLTFDAPDVINTLPGPFHLTLADFDHDNKLDLVSVNKFENIYLSQYTTYSGNSVSVYRSGVIITPTNGDTFVREGDVIDTYDIVLASAPVDDVKITFTYDDSPAGIELTDSLSNPIASGDFIIFSALDWDTPQTITITAPVDGIGEGQLISPITHTISSVGDADYDASVAPDIDVYIADIDQAGVTTDLSGGSTPGRLEITEGFSNDDYLTVVLESAPTANVAINISHSSQISLSSAVLNFAPENWSTPQSVYITAVNDQYIEGTVQENIIFNASSSDAEYDGFLIPSIEVNIVDNDLLYYNPAYPGQMGDVKKDGLIDSLDYEYVVHMFCGGGICEEINYGGDIDHDAYLAVGDAGGLGSYIKVALNLIDNFEIIISESYGSTDVSEDGIADSYNLYLRQQPSLDVSVTISIMANGQVITDETQVIFTRLDYYKPQTVTVSAIDDFFDEADPHTGTISHTAASADPKYNNAAAKFMNNGVETADIIVNITDNDTAGVVMTESGGSTTVDEHNNPPGSNQDTVDIRLTSLPISDVLIEFSVPDGQTTVFPESIIFTPVNGMTNQTITITAVNDDIYEGGTHSGKVWGTLTSLDPNYPDAVGSFDVEITESPPPDSMPSLSITDISLDERNVGTRNFDFKVNLSSVSGMQTTVMYEVVDGTATVADNDYSIDSPMEMLVFNPGEVEKTITVVVKGDTKVENTEQFYINLISSVDSPVNATISKSQGVGTINNDDTLSYGWPGAFMAPSDLTCRPVSSQSLDWIFNDNSTDELGFRLYDALADSDEPIKEVTSDESSLCDYAGGDSANCRLINETDLAVNTEYVRQVRAFNAYQVSSATPPVACYTLANVPNQISILNVSDDSIVIKLNSDDGNPPDTKYAISAVYADQTSYVLPDGNFSATESWHTYEEFGGDNGIEVTGVAPQSDANVSAASVKMVLATGQDYCFSAQAQNGDGISTDPSAISCSISTPPPVTQPNITVLKGVAVNLAWNSNFGLFSTAWAGDKFIINANEPLSRVLGVFAWLLNISLIILLVIFALSLQQSLKHLKHEFKYPETFKLIRLILSGEANDSYQKHAQQTEEGIFNKSSYHWHKTLHNLSQGTFIGAMALAGLKLMILGALLAGLVNLNHTSLAQNEPYNQINTPVAEGDVLTYIIEVKNNITGTAQGALISNATISDILDTNLENFTVTGLDNCGDYTDNSTSSDLNISGIDVAIGTTCFITFTADVKIGSAGNTITNQAQVTGSNFNLPTNETSNLVMAAAPINGNLNQPPTNGNLNQPPTNDNLNQAPTNGNLNQPPTNGNINQTPNNDNQNVNQTPIVSPIEEQWPPIAIIGQIFSPITDIFENPEVEQASQNVVTPILIAIAAINVLPALLFSTLYLLPFLHLLFLEPLMIFFGKKRKKWGIVYNSLTKLPVDLALVRLYNKETNQLVQTKVTDRDGRYIMIAKDPGKYYLSVTKPGFISPTTLLRDEKQDSKYIDLYHGEAIEVTEKDAVLTANIPLDPAEKKSLAFSEVIRSYLLKNLRLIVSYVGIILALVVVLIIPTAITIGCLILHVLFFLAFRRFILPAKPKSWGIVYDAKTKEPLGSSVVRIFDMKFNKLLETQVTDSKGRYSFLVGKNEYQLLTEKPGYQNKSVKPVDLVKNEEIVNLDVSLDKI